MIVILILAVAVLLAFAGYAQFGQSQGAGVRAPQALARSAGGVAAPMRIRHRSSVKQQEFDTRNELLRAA